MGTPADGLDRLRAAAASGELDKFCQRHHIRAMTAFGSTIRRGWEARDLDVAVLCEPGSRWDHLKAWQELATLAETETVDLVCLDRAGAVLKERALVGSVALYESEPAALANAALAAIAERIETDPMRWLNLELLSSQ